MWSINLEDQISEVLSLGPIYLVYTFTMNFSVPCLYSRDKIIFLIHSHSWEMNSLLQLKYLVVVTKAEEEQHNSSAQALEKSMKNETLWHSDKEDKACTGECALCENRCSVYWWVKGPAREGEHQLKQFKTIYIQEIMECTDNCLTSDFSVLMMFFQCSFNLCD